MGKTVPVLVLLYSTFFFFPQVATYLSVFSSGPTLMEKPITVTSLPGATLHTDCVIGLGI